MNQNTTTQRESEETSAHPLMISAVRHAQRDGSMMAILGCCKVVLRQPR